MMQKRHKPYLFALLVVIAVCVWAFIDPLKVTDPSDPRFNPDRFKFSDYNGRDELITVYKKLFPVGTPKEFVDRVLVEAGGADCNPVPNNSLVIYCRQPKTIKHWDVGPHFLVSFDAKNNLLNIRPNGGEEIYPDQASITEENFLEKSNDR